MFKSQFRGQRELGALLGDKQRTKLRSPRGLGSFAVDRESASGGRRTFDYRVREKVIGVQVPQFVPT